jgi:hypothetical protein
MTDEQLQKLREIAKRPSGDAKAVSIACNDGDVLQGFALFVSDTEHDVVFELHSSNNAAKYKNGTCYSIKWDEITDFHELG